MGKERVRVVTGCSQEIGSCVVESISTAIFTSVKKKNKGQKKPQRQRICGELTPLNSSSPDRRSPAPSSAKHRQQKLLAPRWWPPEHNHAPKLTDQTDNRGQSCQ